MRNIMKTSRLSYLLLAVFLVAVACQGLDKSYTGTLPKKITVSQQGEADVTGNDGTALQMAMDLLAPGDTLEIGPGVYTLENSVVIPVCGVVIRGVPGKTILKKGPGVSSKVVDGGDWGEKDVVVAEPEKFRMGMGVSLLDDRNSGGYNVVVATILRIDTDTLRLSEWSVNDLNYIDGNTRVENKFPLLSAYGVSYLTIEGITADGNKEENPQSLDGCRGGAIYLFDCKNSLVTNCVARNYNGDGISFQITDKITVTDCEVFGNTGFGVHPGTGSSNSLVKNCHIHHNDVVGLFLCYRVRYGTFNDNLIEHNGRYGISIGHKDSDNLFVNNTVRNNGTFGVYFRKNHVHVGGHRNVFRENKILDNGNAERGYGVFVEATNQDEVFEDNRIEETRSGEERTQQYGVYITKGPSSVKLTGNTMNGHIKGDYLDLNSQ